LTTPPARFRHLVELLAERAYGGGADGMWLAGDESGLGKIDPAAAMFDAAELMGLNPASKMSVYEDKDLLIL
jgi:hypothetical protein